MSPRVGVSKHGMEGGNFRQCWLQSVDGAVGVELGDDQRVGSQAVGAGVVAGDDAGDVGAGDGGKDGVVVAAGDALGGETRQVGHEPRGDLGGLQAVENDYDYFCH